MISVLLFVFLLQLVIHLINTAGKQTINDVACHLLQSNPLLWLLFTKFPTAQSREAAELAKMRREVVQLNREMTNTSAQDEFAKWAKLRRQHDKLKEKYEERSRNHQSLRYTFDKAVTTLRWLGTQGLQFVCNFWFSKQAMFWLPQGWVPYPAEWILSFPRAPLGSISINVWAAACAAMIGLASEVIVGVWTLRSGEVQVGARKGEKIQMEGMPGAAGGTREKKEL